MTRRKFAWLVLVLLLLGSVVGVFTGFKGTVPLTFTREEAQQRIDAKLAQPLVLKHGIQVDGAVVNFADDRLDLTFTVETTRLGSTYTLTGRTLGEVRYDNERGAFFFRPTDVEIIDAQKNGSTIGARTGQLIERWGTAKMVERKERVAGELKQWAEEKILHAAQNFLEDTPVYKLPDTFAGKLKRAALQEVHIDNDKLVVTISYVKALGELTFMVFVCALVGLLSIGLAIALLSCPEALLFVALLGP